MHNDHVTASQTCRSGTGAVPFVFGQELYHRQLGTSWEVHSAMRKAEQGVSHNAAPGRLGDELESSLAAVLQIGS